MNITNELVTEYINGFYRPMTSELGELRDEAEAAKVPIILRETESFLNFITATVRPRKILEIGTAVGYSAQVFAMCGAEVVTIEKDEKMAQTAAHNIEKSPFAEKIKILVGDGEDIIRENFKIGLDCFDLVFIDAAKSHYKRFLDAALPLCKSGSLIISDNVLLKAATASDSYDPSGRFKTNIKNMRRYIEYIYSHPQLQTTVIACGDGLALNRCI